MSKQKSTQIVIPEHQYVWIYQAAFDHFAAKIADLEVKLMRCERFKNEPTYEKYGLKAKPRAEDAADVQRWLGEYRRLCDYLVQLKSDLSEKQMSESAPGIVDAIRAHHGLTVGDKNATPKRKRSTKSA
jgi:hypothetical protein